MSARSLPLVWVPLAWLLPALAGASLHAQTPPAADAPPAAVAGQPPITTLHVYMDLIQVPVLVLDSDHNRMKPIDPSKFFVSLDSGPAFHPRHVRQEGDDPITLGILLDPDTEPDIMPEMSAALSALAPAALRSHDHVTLYAMDCGLLRTLNDVPADPEVLKSGVDRALAAWLARRKEKHPVQSCQRPVQLWDAMAYAVRALGELPGRRVLLAVTSGQDGGSRYPSADLLQFAQDKGVAIFGYGPRAQGSGGRAVPLVITSRPLDQSGPTGPFDTICQSTGGVILPAQEGWVRKELANLVRLVRERYILEFSMPRNGTSGRHDIEVTIPRVSRFAYIRTAGVSIVLPDSALAADPNTIPTDQSDAPEMGRGKILKPN